MPRPLTTPILQSALALLVALLAACSSPPPRPERSLAELFASRAAEDAAQREVGERLLATFVKRAEAEAREAAKTSRRSRATIDLLIISGGGDWGAFGAGVLKGWGKVKGELARPQFDVVTGVSTGAMIAPFAFLGDDESIERIVQLYRHPREDWVSSRGFFFFLPNNPSFYALPGLEREMRTALDRRMLERIAAEENTGRGLLVNTTNIDLGQMRLWDIVAETRKALASDNQEHVYSILLASAGIPAVFPSRGRSEEHTSERQSLRHLVCRLLLE